MLPTFIEIENILKTLPVSYYIGRNVPLKLTNENGSYYVPMDDEAYISYPMFNNVMTKIEHKLNDENIERLTRTLTYHEISHAFITPKSLSMNNVVNVFEDERIESMCRNYYKGVNFKELLMLVNDWDGHPNFRPSALQMAMVNGQKIVLDEINLLPFESLRFFAVDTRW